MSAFKIHCARAIMHWLVNSVGVGAVGPYFRCEEGRVFFST